MIFPNIIASAAITGTVLYSLFLAVKRDRSLASYSLIAALLMTATFHALDLLTVNNPERFMLYKRWSLIAESLLPVTWLMATLTAYRSEVPGSVGIFQKTALASSLLFVAVAVLLPIDRFYYAPDFDIEKILFLDNAGFAFYICLLVYLILALVNLEMTLRTAGRTALWRIKFDVIGIGALIAVLIFYYSKGLLYRTINMNLLPVMSVAMLLSVLLMFYSRTRRGSDVRLYVSKQMAYSSVVILAVGLYLIGLGLLGEGMRYLGKDLSKAFMIFLGFVATLGMVIVLLSESIQRRIRVFLHKNFYASKYDYRAQWLQFTEKVSSPKSEEGLLHAILEGFCETFGMVGAVLFLDSADRNDYRAAVTYEFDGGDCIFSKDNALIHYMKNKKRIFSIKDDKHEIAEQNRAFFEESGTALVVPLFARDEVAGFIALARPLHEKEVYTYEDYDLMKTLARQAYSLILNLRLADELSRAREMEMMGKISSFVIHDLKNLVSSLSLMVQNAADHINNPDFQQDMLQSLGSTVGRMQGLIARLKNLREKKGLVFSIEDLHKIARETVNQTMGKGDHPEIELCGSVVFAHADAEEIGKVVLNLLLNAVDASGDKGRITVETGAAGAEDMAFVRVSDEGCGMPKDFQEQHLFKPFKTTKKKGLGIGLYQCKQIIEAHHGKIEVMSGPGKGSVFTVYLPLAEEPKYAAEEMRA